MGTKLGKINSELKQTVKITEEEYSLIKDVWTRIEFEPKVHGTGFYLRLFAKHPQYIKYFLTDHGTNDINPDAFMVVKFTVIMEILGYLILDYHNKPKQFNQMVGYIGMMHKDMNLELEDLNNFCTSLIDYLKEVMGDLMTDTCETVFVAFFRNIQDLMVKSMAEDRQRFAQEYDDDENYEENPVVVDSPFKALLPCTWSGHSNKLIYGQPREYWVLRQQEWKYKKESWKQEAQLLPVGLNVQNTLESTSSDDDDLDKVEKIKKSDFRMQSTYLEDDNRGSSISSQRTIYSNSRGQASTPHFDEHISEFPDDVDTSDIEESYLINNGERYSKNVKLTPRERHRAQAVVVKSHRSQPSSRLISSTDTSSPRHSEGSSARERRRSTWN